MIFQWVREYEDVIKIDHYKDISHVSEDVVHEGLCQELGFSNQLVSELVEIGKLGSSAESNKEDAWRELSCKERGSDECVSN